MARRKPRHRSGYSREETLLVKSALLTVAVTLDSHLDDICIVGGLVPSLLIDHDREDFADRHVGTSDLDVALSLGLLDDRRYAELSERLRQEDFEPDENEAGNQVRQRWKLSGKKVTIDFLIPPRPGVEAGQMQDLESDLAAVATGGLKLAFDERREVELAGLTLEGEFTTRKVPICGPAAFLVLKALALRGRGERKDAYDLVYVIEHAPEGLDVIARQLREHNELHGQDVRRALDVLGDDFASLDSVGPQRVAKFVVANDSEIDAAAADARGHVDDLLSACRRVGLVEEDRFGVSR